MNGFCAIQVKPRTFKINQSGDTFWVKRLDSGFNGRENRFNFMGSDSKKLVIFLMTSFNFAILP
ncbi:hypothetical protein [Laspinema olomoucense]|uniref:hypothetical protein n=1 Tax=Laspinema olomoucense TaxID=3231600 RepID=UPI0021BB8B76|nr:hypothetical protein [Laspinema sp. D3a]